MRKGHLALGIFLLFFLLEFTIPSLVLPTTEPSIGGVQLLESSSQNLPLTPTNNLLVFSSEENTPPLPDNPLGTGRETLVEWWNTNYDYRRRITIVEPNIATRTLEPVHVYLTFSGDVARQGIIAVAYWDLLSWHEIPSQIWNATTHTTGPTTFYDSCTVYFPVNITKNYQEIFYIYYDDDYSVAPSYVDHITAIPADSAVEDDDTMPWVWSNVESVNYTDVDTIFIRSSASQYEHSAILLVDTLRGGSDWGGPCCGLISARYGDDDAFNTNNGTSANQYMLLGEFALDPYLETPELISTTRANVAPDNPAEAWVDGAGVWILDDGPLFTRIKIVTSDGGYETSSSAYPSDPYQDSHPRSWGSHGFFNYTIIYTFYWHGDNLYVNILLDIEANPQEPGQQCAVKNYGDWPHIMTFTCGIGTPGVIDARQNRKSWYGSKYGLYNESVDGRRRDFPIEPWMVWYDNESGSDPSVGVIAKVNPVGWEVLSLAVTGMGDNTMLQQILREGHQGDFYVMPAGQHYVYDYTIYTAAYGTNFAEVRSLAAQTNQPVSLSQGQQELYRHNILTCTSKDAAGTNVSNVQVYIYNSTDDLVRSGTTVAAAIVFQELEDDTYTIVSNYTLLSTYGGSITFLVNTTSLVLDHSIQRGWEKTIGCQLSYLTLNVVDWYDDSILPTYAEVFFDKASTGTQIFAVNASPTASTYMYPDQYNVSIRYINRFRIHNQTTPLTVSSVGDTDVAIGIVAREHRTKMELKAPTTLPYVEIPYNVSRTFIVFYSDLDAAGSGIDVEATSIPYIANWTLYNSTADQIDSGILTSVPGEIGNFSMTFDASLYLVNETYQLRFFLDANAPVDYWQAFLSVSIVIRGREVVIQPERSSYTVYWNNSLTFSVYLNDTAENKAITGATPRYFGVGFSGTLLPNGTDGWYTATFRVEQISIGTYTITIQAQIAAYEDATAQILLLVQPQPTQTAIITGQTSDQSGINIRDLLVDDLWVPVGDLLIFTFNYTGQWNQLILNASGQISYQVGYNQIEYIGNGIYRVTINTSTIPIGTYSAAVGFSATNYDIAILAFNFEVRLIPSAIQLVAPTLNGTTYDLFLGDMISLRVYLNDTWHSLPITGATLFIDIPYLGLYNLALTDLGDGFYGITGIVVFLEGFYELNIRATAPNHVPSDFNLQLRVQTHPTTRNIITFGLIAAIIGIIILLSWLLYTRIFAIPWLIRKIRKMTTTIGKGKMPKLSGRDRRRISTRPNIMTDFMQDAYEAAKIPFVTTAVPLVISAEEREAEEVDIWKELDQIQELGRDQKLELFEEMKRIPARERIWFLEDLKRQMEDRTRFKRAPMESPPEGILDETAEAELIQARLDAIPALSAREKKALFKQISSLPPEEREEVFETLKEKYEKEDEDNTS